MGIFWIIIAVAVLNLLIPPLAYPKYVAWYNSKNPENILDGCLYYVGVSHKGRVWGGVSCKNRKFYGRW